MDIRTKDKIFYQIDSQIGALLCTALPSVFEQVEKPAAVPLKPAVPYFGITELTSGFVAVQIKRGAETLFFDGFPQVLRAAWPDVPPEIEREYTRRFVQRSEVHTQQPKIVAQFEAFKKKLLG